MHWVTKPGTSLAGEVRITTRVNEELPAIPGVRNFGAHIGQALLSDEPYGIDFGENWISVDPSVDYDETLAKIQEVVDGYPGLHRDVQTYLKERIREVLDRIRRGHRRPHLRPGPRRAAGQGGRGQRDRCATSPASIEEHVDRSRNIPQVERRGRPRRPPSSYGLKPGDVRRAGLDADRRRGGRRHLPRRQGLRRPGLEHARDPPEPDRHREPADRHARAAVTVRLTDVADVKIEPDAERHPPREPVPAHRRRRQLDGEPGPRLGGRATSRTASTSSSSRSGTAPSCWASTRSARRPQRRLRSASTAAGIGIFLLLRRRSAAAAWPCCPS